MTAAHVIESASVEQTQAVGRAIARCAEAGDIVALYGQLGAGKTQLVRGMAEGLGIDPRDVASPTFVISHEYEPTDGAGDVVLVHIDAYRLTGPDDLGPIGWGTSGEELREGAVVAIEWADRIAEALGDDRLDVTIEHTPETDANAPINAGRRLTLEPHGSWHDRLAKLRLADDA